MSDTRTIYLKNNEGTIYTSDPSTTGYEYLNMSDFDSLNPSENSIFTSAGNTSLMYSSYEVKIVLTFMSDYDNGRQSRAEWVAKNQNSITQISVANTNNPDVIFSKQAKMKTIDFVENPYVNGVQAELTLELAGRWQSSVKRTRAIVYPYTGGTKKYSYRYSTLDRSLLANRNLVLNSATPHVGTGTNIYDDKPANFLYPLANGATTGSLYNSLDMNIPLVISFDWSITGSTISGSFLPQWNGAPWFLGMYPAPAVNVSSTNTSGHYVGYGGVSSSWQGTSANALGIRTDNLQGTLTIKNMKLEQGGFPSSWTPAPEDTNPKPTYKYGYQIITDEVKTDGYNGFIINIPTQTTPVNVTLTAPNGTSATIKTSQTNVPLQISSDMIGYSLDNFDTFTLLNKGFPASKYWDNLLSVYSDIQTILNFNTVTVSVTSGTGTSIPFEFYLYKLQDLI